MTETLKCHAQFKLGVNKLCRQDKPTAMIYCQHKQCPSPHRGQGESVRQAEKEGAREQNS